MNPEPVEAVQRTVPRAMKRPFPLATLAILTASVAVYLAELAGGGMSVCQELGFTPAHPSFGTALVSMWLHDPDHVAHLAGNLVAVAVVGSVVEPVLGRSRLVTLYVAAGLGGVAMHWLVEQHAEAALVGASGGITGLMAVSAVVRPRLMLAFVVSYMAMNVFGLFVSTALMPPGTSLACHVGGFTCGVAAVLLAEARGVRWVVAPIVDLTSAQALSARPRGGCRRSTPERGSLFGRSPLA